MNVKKVFRSLLVILTCCLSLSCVLDVLPENKTGSVSFTLPQTNVNTRSTEVSSAVYPEVYKIVATSIPSNKIVYNREHAAGSDVSISDIAYGKYVIDVTGESASQKFIGTSGEVEVRGPTKIKIELKASKLFGSIELSVDATQLAKDVPFDKVEVAYSLYKGNETIDREIPIPLDPNTKKGTIIIPNLYLDTAYSVRVFGTNGQFIYYGVSASDTIVFDENKPTKLEINSFEVKSGNIYITGKPEVLKALEGSTLSVIKKDTDEEVKTVKLLNIVAEKGYLVTNLAEGTYRVEFGNSLTDYVYTLDEDIEIIPGKTVNTTKAIVASPKGVCYVSTKGKNTNNGAKDTPYQTLAYALDKAPTNSKVVVLDPNFVIDGEELVFNQDKSLHITFIEKGTLDGSITIDNPKANIVFTNISMGVEQTKPTPPNVLFVKNGSATLGNNAFIPSVVVNSNINIAVTESNLLDIGDITLSDGAYINVIGELPVDFNVSVGLTNYATTKPVLKVNSQDHVDPKVASCFVLQDSKYQIDERGFVIPKEIPKGTISIINTDGSIFANEGIKVTITDGREFSETKSLDSFPLIFSVDRGIYQVIVEASAEQYIRLIDGDYYRVNGGQNIDVNMSSKNDVSVSFTIPTADLNNSYFVLKNGKQELDRQGPLLFGDTDSEITITSKTCLLAPGETITASVENVTEPSTESVVIFSKAHTVKNTDFAINIDMVQVSKKYTVSPNIKDFEPYRGQTFEVSIGTKKYSTSIGEPLPIEPPADGSSPAEPSPITSVELDVGYLTLNKPLQIIAKIKNPEDVFLSGTKDITLTGTENSMNIKVDLIKNNNRTVLWKNGRTSSSNSFKISYYSDSTYFEDKNITEYNLLNGGTMTDFVTCPNGDIVILDNSTRNVYRFTDGYIPSDTYTFANNTEVEKYPSITCISNNDFYVPHYTERNTEIDISYTNVIRKLHLADTPSDNSNEDQIGINGGPDPNTSYIAHIVLADSNTNKFYIAFQTMKNKYWDGFTIYEGYLEGIGDMFNITPDPIFSTTSIPDMNTKAFEITDMNYINNNLYITTVDLTKGDRNTSGNFDTYSSRGALIIINTSDNNSVNTYGLNTTKKPATKETDYYNQKNYFAEENTEDVNNYFIGPRKIVAIKNKELIIADAGVLYNTTDVNTLKKKNRYVIVGLDGIIKKHIDFSDDMLFDGSILGNSGSGFGYDPKNAK